MINRTVESTFGCENNYIFHREDVEARAVPFLLSFLLKSTIIIGSDMSISLFHSPFQSVGCFLFFRL